MIPGDSASSSRIQRAVAGGQRTAIPLGKGLHVIDQPRRGQAAKSTQPLNLPATPDEQMWFGIFRLGVWPTLYPGVQFSRDSSALNQFFRQSCVRLCSTRSRIVHERGYTVARAFT